VIVRRHSVDEFQRPREQTVGLRLSRARISQESPRRSAVLGRLIRGALDHPSECHRDRRRASRFCSFSRLLLSRNRDPGWHVLCHPAPALRELIPQGDAEVINDINAAIMPLIERIADKLESTIKEISERVDRQLAEMQQEIRSAARRERSEVLDIPSWRELRKVS
jgi:hypothetical protein